MMKNNGDVKYSFGNYDKYIDEVQKDYEKQQKRMKFYFKALSYIRAVCVAFIPFLLIIDIQAKVIVSGLAVISTACEFFIRFNGYDKKINALNYVTSSLTHEYNLYSEKCDIYDVPSIEAKKLYVEKTSEIIRDTDIKTFRQYDPNAIDSISKNAST